MFIFDSMENVLRAMRVYLFGRGLLTLGILAASFIGSAVASPFIPALVIAIGGACMGALMRLTSQAMYEEKMVELYRNDIAHDLHIAPAEVTRAHLKIAALDNEVIEQALTRQRHINIVSFATSALAGAVTLGLLYFMLPPGAHALADNPIAQKITGFFAEHFGNAARIVQYFAAGIISGTSSLILHDGLEAAIGVGSGISKAAAHDLILGIDRDVQRGRSVSPEQVYGVLVAGDLELQQAIKRQFGQSYSQMKPQDQHQVLATIGVLDEMQALAAGIMQGSVKPGHLAYMIGEARGNRQKQVTVEMTPALPTPVRGNFVERLNLAPREAASHAERVQADRAAAAAAPVL